MYSQLKIWFLRVGSCSRGRGQARSRASGFSLIELMVAVTVLAMITVALMVVLNQTQRVLRGSTSQVDVLETGRAVLDMIDRELCEFRPVSKYTGEVPTFIVILKGAHEVRYTNRWDVVPLQIQEPLTQVLPRISVLRTNYLNDVFFVTLRNRQWRAIGYKVWGEKGVVGDLYRVEWSWNAAPERPIINTNLALYVTSFCYTTPASYARYRKIASGVVHFHVRPLVGSTLTNQPGWQRNVKMQPLPEFNACEWLFYDGIVPPMLEVELGVLEPALYARIEPWDEGRVREYLNDKPSAVQIFKRVIQIPAFDPEVYK